MTKPENNKDKNKKTTAFSKLKNMSKDKKHISIAIGIILVCLVSAFFVWKVYYHGESADYIATQKQINKVNSADKKRFNKIHQDSFPTVQEAHDYLVQATGHKDLTSSAISYKTIDNDLVNKYGNAAMKALVGGYCLDENMAPQQEITQEVNLALMDPNQKDYVGFAEKRYETSIYKPGQINDLGHTKVPLYMPYIAPSNKLTWQNDSGYYISSPVILPATINEDAKKNCPYRVLMLFVQVPSGSDTSISSFKKEINSIDVKVDNKKIGLSGSHKETNTGSNQIGLQMATISKAANKLNIWDANEIKAGSIVPVAFDMPLKSIENADGTNNDKAAQLDITINGNVLPSAFNIYNSSDKVIL